MRIGYARVSTAEQNLNLQLDALKKAKCKRIYEEHGSGKDSARLELLSCLKALRADDVLVVWRLDRLGRSLSELVRIAGQLEHRKIGTGIDHGEDRDGFLRRQTRLPRLCRAGRV